MAKKPSNVNLKSFSRKVKNQYGGSDIYDLKSPMYEQEDTYTDHGGNGYILDKEGNEYPVFASITQGDAGRIAGGSQNFSVKIALPKDVSKDGGQGYLYYDGYNGIMSSGRGANIVADLESGYYLEDYALKHKNDLRQKNVSDEFYNNLLANAEEGAKSYSVLKKERDQEKADKFDAENIPVNLRTLKCTIENGNVNSTGTLYLTSFKAENRWSGGKDTVWTGSGTVVQLPENIIDAAVIAFNINGYDFKDFEGCSFTIELPGLSHSDYPIRYNSKTGEWALYEKKNDKYHKVDFERLKVKVGEVAISSTCPFFVQLQKANKKFIGNKSEYITADKVWRLAMDILDTGGYRSGYNDVQWGLGSSSSHMNKVRANAKKHAREELSTQYDNLINRQTFSYDDFKQIVALLPAKVLEEAAETAGKAAPVSEGSGASNHITEDKFPSVAVEKMEAWHNGTRKQNVGACNDEKLKMYYDICKVMGFEEQASILAKELKSRGLQNYVVDSKQLNFNNMRRVSDTYDDFDDWGKDYEFNKPEDDNYYGGGLPESYNNDGDEPDWEDDYKDWSDDLTEEKRENILMQIAGQIEAGEMSGNVEGYEWTISMSYKDLNTNPLGYPLERLENIGNDEDYEYIFNLILNNICVDFYEGIGKAAVTPSGAHIYYTYDLNIY